MEQLGFEKPTDIQKEAIPVLLSADRDFIGLAQTGTGKTAAFGLPLLELLDADNPNTQGLILAPTRELGQQIAEQIELYSKYLKRVNVLAVYGGASIVVQMKALKKPRHVIIATPGRLLDLIRRKAVNLEQLQYLILDEADEMVNMGFKEELDEILKHTPDEKITWLFSATMPKEIKHIVNNYMDNPYEIQINREDRVNTNIAHQYVQVENKTKRDALMRFMDIDPEMRCVVFCRTRNDTQELAEALARKKYNADALHGDLSQAQRDKVMGRFKNHQLDILVATDVAARGIDVNDLTHVFHYSLPDEAQYYTHRSGRTARAGKTGTSIAFVNSRDVRKLKFLAKDLQIDFEQVLIPNSDAIESVRIEKWCIDVLAKHPKSNLDEELLSKALMIFGNLSKEELVAKLVARELEKVNTGDSKDLNQDFHKVQTEHRSKRRARGRGRGGRGRGDRDRNRSGNFKGKSKGGRGGSYNKSKRRKD
ncbi:DEAD/DEAH box helicase [bacterium]|nr:DEAD/DEAH box helicase [bacterium]